MMRCDDAVLAVQDVLKGAGTPMELALRLPGPVHQHLQSCQRCRVTAQELLALDNTLCGLAAPEAVPPNLLPSIMARVRTVPAGGGSLDFTRVIAEDVGQAPASAAREIRFAVALLAVLAALQWDMPGSPAGWTRTWVDAIGAYWDGLVQRMTDWLRAAGDAAASCAATLSPHLAAAVALFLLGAVLIFTWRACRPIPTRLEGS